MPKPTLVYDVSWTTIARVLGVTLLIWVVIKIQDIIALLFIVVVVVSALDPIVKRWSTKMPRWLAVSLLLTIILSIIVGIFTLLLPPLVNEGQALVSQISLVIGVYIPSVKDDLLNLSNFNSFSQSFGQLGGKIYSTTLSVFSVLIAGLTMLVLTFYLLLEQHRARDYLQNHLPIDKKESILDILRKITAKMGAWVRGQLILAFIIGLTTFVALTVMQLTFGMPYALTLAVWSGVTEIIPYIGPILGAIPAILVALNISPLVAVIVLLVYIFIQQVESHILVPKIMQRAVGLSPVTIVIVLLIGGKLAGLMGIILAVPVAAALSVILQEWPQFKKSLAK